MRSVGRDVASTRKPPSRDSAVSAATPALTSGRPAGSGWNTRTRACWVCAEAGAALRSTPATMANRVAMRTMSQDTSIWSIIAFS